MKISEALKTDKLTLSFEVFPPKASTSFDSVTTAVPASVVTANENVLLSTGTAAKSALLSSIQPAAAETVRLVTLTAAEL